MKYSRTTTFRCLNNSNITLTCLTFFLPRDIIKKGRERFTQSAQIRTHVPHLFPHAAHSGEWSTLQSHVGGWTWLARRCSSRRRVSQLRSATVTSLCDIFGGAIRNGVNFQDDRPVISQLLFVGVQCLVKIIYNQLSFVEFRAGRQCLCRAYFPKEHTPRLGYSCDWRYCSSFRGNPSLRAKSPLIETDISYDFLEARYASSYYLPYYFVLIFAGVLIIAFHTVPVT